MGRFVIVAYTPKPGRESDLLALVRKHLRILEKEGLVTERPAHVMRASNGAVIEVFEWRSADAIQTAHGNAAVQALWGEFGAVCDYTPLANLEESRQMFAEFEALEL